MWLHKYRLKNKNVYKDGSSSRDRADLELGVSFVVRKAKRPRTIVNLRSQLCSRISAIVLVGGLLAPLFIPAVPVLAAGSYLYLSPSSAIVGQNDMFNVLVRINTGDEVINAVQANFSYPADRIEFVSVSGSGSAFKTEAPSSGGNGDVLIARGQIGGVKGDVLLATATFRSLAGSGSALMAFTAETQALRNSNNTNALTETRGSTYSLVAQGGAPLVPPAAASSQANRQYGVDPSDSTGPASRSIPGKPGSYSESYSGPESGIAAEQEGSTAGGLLPGATIPGTPVNSKAALWGVLVAGLIAVVAAIVRLFISRRRSAALVSDASMYGPPAQRVVPYRLYNAQGPPAAGMNERSSSNYASQQLSWQPQVRAIPVQAQQQYGQFQPPQQFQNWVQPQSYSQPQPLPQISRQFFAQPRPLLGPLQVSQVASQVAQATVQQLPGASRPVIIRPTQSSSQSSWHV